MDGYTTDVPAVYAAMAKIRNDADWLSVQKAYGIRELSSGTLNPSANFKGTLSQALTEELSKNEVLALKNMLAKKGVINSI